MSSTVDDDQIMDIKLALLDLAIWSCNRHRELVNRPRDKDDTFAIVLLGSEHGGGYFAFTKATGFYKSRQEAFEAALKLAASGAERNTPQRSYG